MKCVDCGGKLGTDDRFCGECGAPVTPPSEPVAVSPDRASVEASVIQEDYPVQSVAISPDGNRVLYTTGGFESDVYLREIQGGEESLHIVCGALGGNGIAFLPDGKSALSCMAETTAQVRDTTNGRIICSLEGKTEHISQGIFSPDGRYILTTGFDNSIRLWDASSGAEIHRFQISCRPSAVSFSSDSRLALSGDAGGNLRLWDLETGQELSQWQGHKELVVRIALSSDSSLALSWGVDNIVCLWDVEQGTEINRLEGHSKTINTLAFTPDGQKALACWKDEIDAENEKTSSIYIWDLKTGQEYRRIECDTAWFGDVSISPDGTRVLSTTADNQIQLWDVETGHELHGIDSPTGWNENVWFSPDGLKAYSWFVDDESITVKNIETGGSWRYPRGNNRPTWICGFSPDGQSALVCSQNNMICRWNTDQGTEINRLLGHDESITGLAISAEGRMALSGSWNGIIHLWDLVAGEELRRFFEDEENPVSTIDLSPDGRYFLTGWMGDNFVRLRDVESGSELHQLNVGPTKNPETAVFSPDGSHVLAGCNDGTLHLWDVETGRKVRKFQGHESQVKSVAISHDGRFALSGSNDQTVRLWNLKNGKEIDRFDGHTDSVYDVAFSPDDKTAVSCSKDKTLRTWSLPV